MMITINPVFTQIILMRVSSQEHKVAKNVKKKECTGLHYGFV